MSKTTKIYYITKCCNVVLAKYLNRRDIELVTDEDKWCYCDECNRKIDTNPLYVKISDKKQIEWLKLLYE